MAIKLYIKIIKNFMKEYNLSKIKNNNVSLYFFPKTRNKKEKKNKNCRTSFLSYYCIIILYMLLTIRL